jgi:hypothetical protein
VLGAAATVAALKRLQLDSCNVLDSEAAAALAAALSQLPAGLEHLSITSVKVDMHWLDFPTGVLQRLQHLTYLELGYHDIVGPDEASPALQQLQALTLLAGLKLTGLEEEAEEAVLPAKVTSSMLSGMQQLE